MASRIVVVQVQYVGMTKLEYRLLSSAEIADALKQVEGWELKNGLLCKGFEFDQYQKGPAFACAVGFIADQLDHHPDISIGYKRVDVSVSTHSVKGISPYDFELARRIDGVVGGA